jgi:hypothetical protein
MVPRRHCFVVSAAVCVVMCPDSVFVQRVSFLMKVLRVVQCCAHVIHHWVTLMPILLTYSTTASMTWHTILTRHLHSIPERFGRVGQGLARRNTIAPLKDELLTT